MGDGEGLDEMAIAAVIEGAEPVHSYERERPENPFAQLSTRQVTNLWR
jgi:hypothetical protein